MRTLAFLLALFALSACSRASRQPASAEACRDPLEAPAPPLLRSELSFEQTPATMKEKFRWVLDTGRRLEFRGFRAGGAYLLPIVPSLETGEKRRTELVSFPEPTARAVATHMEEAFRRGFAVYPFFSDMGHGHLMLPNAMAAALGRKKEAGKLSDGAYLAEALARPELRVLYHAAEQLKFANGSVPIPELNFLREHRNIVGSLERPRELTTINLGGVPNTAGAPEGWAMVGMFYVSASREGCIPIQYADTTLFLDFSLMAASYVPAEPEDD